MGFLSVFVVLFALTATCINAERTLDGVNCVLPFYYHGKKYTQCTSVADSKPWCAIRRARYRPGSGDWAYCCPNVSGCKKDCKARGGFKYNKHCPLCECKLKSPVCKGNERLNRATNKCELKPVPSWNGILVRYPGQAAVYQVIDGYKRWIPSPAAFNHLYASWGCIVTTRFTAQIPTGKSLKGVSLIRAPRTAPVYLWIDGHKRWIANPETMNRYCYNWHKVISTNNALVSRIANGATINIAGHKGIEPNWNGKLIKFPGNPAVYQVIDGVKHWVPNPQTYNSLYRSWACVVTTRTTAQIPTGKPLYGVKLIRASGHPQVYLEIGGEKRWIVSPDTMNRYCFSWGKVRLEPYSKVRSVRQGYRIF